MVEERGTMVIALGMAMVADGFNSLSNATDAIDLAVEISLYHRLDMQSDREILFTAGFQHWKERTPHQTSLYQA